MTKKVDQTNSCFMTGEIIGKINFHYDVFETKNSKCSFKITNHFSFYDTTIDDRRIGDIVMKVKMMNLKMSHYQVVLI